MEKDIATLGFDVVPPPMEPDKDVATLGIDIVPPPTVRTDKTVSAPISDKERGIAGGRPTNSNRGLKAPTPTTRTVSPNQPPLAPYEYLGHDPNVQSINRAMLMEPSWLEKEQPRNYQRLWKPVTELPEATLRLGAEKLTEDLRRVLEDEIERTRLGVQQAQEAYKEKEPEIAALFSEEEAARKRLLAESKALTPEMIEDFRVKADRREVAYHLAMVPVREALTRHMEAILRYLCAGYAFTKAFTPEIAGDWGDYVLVCLKKFSKKALKKVVESAIKEKAGGAVALTFAFLMEGVEAGLEVYVSSRPIHAEFIVSFKPGWLSLGVGKDIHREGVPSWMEYLVK
jgi:hypothetical protein